MPAASMPAKVAPSRLDVKGHFSGCPRRPILPRADDPRRREPMDYRVETDSMGEVKVAKDRYWGAQTQRSLENFKIGGQRFTREVIRAFGIVKKAAATPTLPPEKLEEGKASPTARACDEVIAGKLDDHFPLVVWQ